MWLTYVYNILLRKCMVENEYILKKWSFKINNGLQLEGKIKSFKTI